jgi:leucyl/phenylalanyl-tRNA--protein transferase
MAAPHFPPPHRWSPDGLVAVGGPLTPERLLAAYRQGIFPWPVDESPSGLLWWSPNPRAVLLPACLHVPRRLARTLRQQRFTITTDTDFLGVVDGCGSSGDRAEGTWITPQIRQCYHAAFRAGIAHSVEVRREGRLVGGLYGICLGGMFAGESMFSRERDASKVALVWLVQTLAARGCCLFDVQMASEHLSQFGVIEVDRDDFRRMLAVARRLACCWPLTPLGDEHVSDDEGRGQPGR